MDLHTNTHMGLKAFGGPGPPSIYKQLPLSPWYIAFLQRCILSSCSTSRFSTLNSKSLVQLWPLSLDSYSQLPTDRHASLDVLKLNMPWAKQLLIWYPSLFFQYYPSFPKTLASELLIAYHCISISCPRCLGSVSFGWGKAALYRLNNAGLNTRIHGFEYWLCCSLCDANFSELPPCNLQSCCEYCSTCCHMWQQHVNASNSPPPPQRPSNSCYTCRL